MSFSCIAAFVIASAIAIIARATTSVPGIALVIAWMMCYFTLWGFFAMMRKDK